MNGITPPLDTLLPHVLAKRMAGGLGKNAVVPVKPGSAAEAPRPPYSDSRLNTSTNAKQAAAYKSTGRTPAAGAALANLASSQQAGQEVKITLSPAARALSALLSQSLPSLPSIKASLPLLPGMEQLSPAVLSAVLGASIRESGLFYEAHLARWYSGKFAREMLEKEPQTNLRRRHKPAASDRQEVSKIDRPLGQQPQKLFPVGGSPDGQSSLERPLNKGQQSNAESLDNTLKALLQAVDKSDETSSKLKNIVANQLGMLATPMLQWEGEIWPGVLMALLIHFPDKLYQRQFGQQQGESAAEEDQPWRTELTINLKQFGRLKVNLELDDNSIALRIQASSREVLAYLEVGREALIERLHACGFQSASVHTQITAPDNDQLVG